MSILQHPNYTIETATLLDTFGVKVADGCQWHAADAIVALKAAGMLADWGRLFALYAGW